MGAGGPGAWRRRGWLRGPPRSDHHPESVSYCSGNGRGEARPTTPAQAPAPTGRVVSHGPGLIAIPCQDTMFSVCAAAIAAMCAAAPAGTQVRWQLDDTNLAGKRDAAVRELLGTPALQWLLMCDSDMAPPADVVARLLGHHVGIVGALCFQRKPPYTPCVGMPRDWLPLDGQLHECLAVGTGCLLVRRAVVEQLADPWFNVTPGGEGEDLAFCLAARAAG